MLNLHSEISLTKRFAIEHLRVKVDLTAKREQQNTSDQHLGLLQQRRHDSSILQIIMPHSDRELLGPFGIHFLMQSLVALSSHHSTC